MAYRHHPQALPPATPRVGGGRRLVAVAAAGLVALTATAGGAWYLLGSPAEAPAPIAAAQVEAGAQPPLRAPTRVPERRQSETVRGSLIMPDDRLLTAADVDALSRGQLAAARAEILAARDQGSTEPSAMATANLRLIEAAQEAR